MAEIPVTKKSSLAWLWILLAILALALIAWWVLSRDDKVEGVPVEAVSEGTIDSDPGATPVEPIAGMSIATILSNPAIYVGRDDFAAEVTVPEVPTDRGFWIEGEGQRMFAVLIDNPQEVPIDINAGQRLRVANGMIRDASFIDRMPGKPLDADTIALIRDQAAYLVVDEDDIAILARN